MHQIYQSHLQSLNYGERWRDHRFITPYSLCRLIFSVELNIGFIMYCSYFTCVLHLHCLIVMKICMQYSDQ